MDAPDQENDEEEVGEEGPLSLLLRGGPAQTQETNHKDNDATIKDIIMWGPTIEVVVK